MSCKNAVIIRYICDKTANLGSMVNGAVTINDINFSDTIYVAEGIETALSVAQVKPCDRVIASLSVSNLKNVPVPAHTKTVILCADYDGANALSNKALLAAVDFYKSKGLQVKICYPEKIPGMAKFDFNDALKYLGANSIVKSLNNTTKLRPFMQDQDLNSATSHDNKTLHLPKELSR